MSWTKRGLIYGPSGESSWAKSSALTPTPIKLNENVIRVFAGFRDEYGISRIGYVDVDASSPNRVIRISETPVIDIGQPGTFDDNGMILGDVVWVGERLYMFYVGFQLVQKAKFLAFTGLAISDDFGERFTRYKEAPILDRAERERYIAAIHSVMYQGGKWRVWYAAGNGWEEIGGRPFPQYHIRYFEAEDIKDFCMDRVNSTLCVQVEGDEYRIGRPRVYFNNGIYQMYYTRGTTKGDYIAGYAESIDGISWVRQDHKLGISLSKEGWDSEALSYPSLLSHGDKTYMFYNGNAMGVAGFGYAEQLNRK